MWTRLLLAAASLALISAGCASSETAPHRVRLPHRASNAVAPWITTQNGRFVDARSGSAVVLRGVNVAVNSSSIVYDKAAAMGANFVRISAPWSTVEPTAPDGAKHHWDEAFLQHLDTAVSDFQKAGVNVLIDFHQFHWSPYFAKVECKQNVTVCNASGIPNWYYADGRFPDTKNGESDAKKAFWTTEAARSEDAYAAFAGMMATRYADAPNVVGYEIFNEPHPGGLGDSTAATDTMLQWQAEIRKVISAVDPKRTVFIMCRGGGEGVGTADLKAFGALDHLALDYHDYFNGIPGIGLTSNGNDWTPSWPATHNQKAERYAGTAASQAAVLSVPLQRTSQWRIPLLIGEWGIHTGVPGALEYQRQMLDLFDSEGVSWTRWNLARGGGFGLLQATGSPTAEAIQIENALRAPATTP
jgi:endoglycosylceramidase